MSCSAREGLTDFRFNAVTARPVNIFTIMLSMLVKFQQMTFYDIFFYFS